MWLLTDSPKVQFLDLPGETHLLSDLATDVGNQIMMLLNVDLLMQFVENVAKLVILPQCVFLIRNHQLLLSHATIHKLDPEHIILRQTREAILWMTIIYLL